MLVRRLRYLLLLSIAYNVAEAVVAVWSGAAAGSTALIAFGLDSVIEVSSAVAVAWQFSGPAPETRERRALRAIAWSFFALAAYVSLTSAHALLTGSAASPAPAGIALAAASLVVMPVISLAQRRTGRALGSVTAVADSRQTLLCTALSAVLLLGLAANALLGWSWADPLAGLAVAGAALREGRNAWKGDACCTPALPRDVSAPAVADTCCSDCLRSAVGATVTGEHDDCLFVGLAGNQPARAEAILRSLDLPVPAVAERCLFRLDSLAELPGLVAKHNAAQPDSPRLSGRLREPIGERHEPLG